MTVKAVKPTGVELTMEMKSQIRQKAPQAEQAPGGLYPMIARSFTMDEYRLMSGWPVSIPDYDIHAKSMVSCSGQVLTDREPPTNIATGALVRWVADASFYDETALQWRPVQNSQIRTSWTLNPSFMPDLITEYEYRNKEERFYLPALNFDSDAGEYLTADFTNTIGGASGYTVIMVMSPNSVYGNNDEVLYNGLWTHGSASEYWIDITMQGRYLWVETETQGRIRGISIAPALDRNRPLYLAIVLDRPNVTFYAAEGPETVRVKSVPTGLTEPVPLDPQVVLGAAPDFTHTADMALLDLGIYADRLSASEVATEFILLSQAYGGD